MENKVWIALATVTALKNNSDLGLAKGAAVNVLNWALNKKDFRDKIKKQLFEYGYKLNELEDIEPFNFDVQYDDNLNEKANTVLKTKSLQWGTFYTF